MVQELRHLPSMQQTPIKILNATYGLVSSTRSRESGAVVENHQIKTMQQYVYLNQLTPIFVLSTFSKIYHIR